MKGAVLTGLKTFFDALDESGAHNDLWNDVSGRLFFGKAPQGTKLSDGPYVVYKTTTDQDEDTFTEEAPELYIEFHLFSAASGSDQILNMETHLDALCKNKSFSITGAVVTMFREGGGGPEPPSVESGTGTGSIWETFVDYRFAVSTTF